jgi:hypothetical protein
MHERGQSIEIRRLVRKWILYNLRADKRTTSVKADLKKSDRRATKSNYPQTFKQVFLFVG